MKTKTKIKLIMETETYAHKDKQGNWIIDLPEYPKYVNVELIERSVK